MKRILSLAALAAVFAWPVIAEVPCAPFSQVLNFLTYTYDEEIIDYIDADVEGTAVRYSLFANPETMSWTVTAMAHGQMIMCAMAAGEDYHDFDFHAWVAEHIGHEVL